MPKIVDEQTRTATRQRIIHVAAREFARLGFDQANINTIAELAGIGKGTIYLYFANKTELFLDMLRHIAQSQMTAIRATLASKGTLQQRLEQLFLTFSRLAQEDSDGFNVYMSALYGVNRAFQTEATKLLRDYLAVISLVLEESRASGEIQISNIEAAALLVLSLTESYVLSAKVLGQSERRISQHASFIAAFILRGSEAGTL